MNTTLLKEGDVVNLTSGMRVYAKIPSKFVYTNAKLSSCDNVTTTDLSIDEKIKTAIEKKDSKIKINQSGNKKYY